MGVDRSDPFIEKPALGSVLIAVLAFGFQNRHIARAEADDKVGSILPHHTAMDIEHFEAEVIVFHLAPLNESR